MYLTYIYTAAGAFLAGNFCAALLAAHHRNHDSATVEALKDTLKTTESHNKQLFERCHDLHKQLVAAEEDKRILHASNNQLKALLREREEADSKDFDNAVVQAVMAKEKPQPPTYADTHPEESAATAVLRYLEANPRKWLDLDALTTCTGKHRNTIKNAVTRLCKARKIRRRHQGKKYLYHIHTEPATK